MIINTDMYIYVLHLRTDKYYVGITVNPETRFELHRTGKGAKWTRLYKPVDVLLLEEIEGNCRKKETLLTLRMMKEYGYENVRGGKYCSIDMPFKSSELVSQDEC